ncbi:MAG: alpha/beta fold hydrolase [Pseudomonadota bacterium]
MKAVRRVSLFLFCAAFSVLVGAVTVRAELSAEILIGDIPPDRVDELISQNANDPRVVFDLLALKSAQSAPGQAAEIEVVRAALAQRFPQVIDADVGAVLLGAADSFLEAGMKQEALEQLYLALERFRASTTNPKILGDLLERIAVLEKDLGDAKTAADLRKAIGELPGSLDAPPGTRSNDPGFVSVEVFYATDRKQTGESHPSQFFGYDRTDGLNYGKLEVTIPRTQVPGTLSAPSIWRLEFSEDPTKHTMLQSITPVEKDAFFASMRQGLDDRESSDAFIFIHGYNVSFDTAAKRTAQLAYDMSFEGLPVLYSWPSRGATTGYVPDTAVVRLSGRRLTKFLEEFVRESGATKIHVIGHSMGNRALTDALELMALRNAPLDEPLFDQIIFAAPDVDQGLFSAILPTIKPLAERLTLYSSDQDWALEASRRLHGNAPRAGQAGEDTLSHKDIDTIDMSDLGEDMLAHSYVSNDQSAILDISTLFWKSADPTIRCGLEAHPEKAQIWQYRKTDCSNLSMLNVVGHLRNKQAETAAQIKQVLRQDFENAPQALDMEALLLSLAAQ